MHILYQSNLQQHCAVSLRQHSFLVKENNPILPIGFSALLCLSMVALNHIILL